LKRLAALFGDSHPLIGDTCNALGMLYKKQGQ
jgi:hypothetical protein